MTELAGCVLLNEQGKILLIHRSTPQLVQWELPGGKVEQGESAEQAAEREVREELGVELTGLDRMGETGFIENAQHFHYVWFRAQIASGSPRAIEEKHDRVGYFSISDLRQEKVSKNLNKLIKAVEDGTINI